MQRGDVRREHVLLHERAAGREQPSIPARTCTRLDSPVDSHAEIYLVSGVDTDAPIFQPRGDAKFNVSDKVLKGAENDITSLEEDTTGAFAELIADGQPGRKYVVGLAEGSVGAELFVARLDVNAPGTPAYYAVLYTACANVDWSLRPKNAQPPTPKNGCLRSTFGAAYTYDERTSSATSLTQAPRLAPYR